MSARTKLAVVETTLSVEALSQSLRVSPEQVVTKFKDARITSWFAETWGEQLFGYKQHVSSNHPGSDARLELGALGPFEISVRCLSNGGIKFQKSKFIGSGRSATKEDLLASVVSVERVVVVDIRAFPLIRFYPIDSKAILAMIYQDRLTASGLSPARFDRWIGETFDTVAMPIELLVPQSAPVPALPLFARA